MLRRLNIGPDLGDVICLEIISLRIDQQQYYHATCRGKSLYLEDPFANLV